MAKRRKLTDTATDDRITLSPFGLWPDFKSRIEGLGGDTPGEDPAYAFHTVYTAVKPGTARWTIAFGQLRGSYGSIVICINALPDEPGSQAQLAKWTTLPIAQIAGAGGRAVIPFDPEPNKRYALLGHFYDPTDASAASLDVHIDAFGEMSDEQRALASKSTFGQRMFRRAPRLRAQGRPTLADPVSQPCTASQFKDPAYAGWLARTGATRQEDPEQWGWIYTLQTLERYAMLKSGANGLGLGDTPDQIPATLANAGCALSTAEIGEPLDDLRGFDFLWSSDPCARTGTVKAGATLIRDSVECLRPGGLAVHVGWLNLSTNDPTPAEGTTLFRRRDLERLAVDLVSRGHLVAQMKFIAPDQVDPADAAHERRIDGDRATAYGIIVRRGE